MKSDCDVVAEHFEYILSLCQNLRTLNWSIYHHEYDQLHFGSWMVVIGNRHFRIKFNWDGKETTLSCFTSKFTNSTSQSNWDFFMEKKLVDKVFEEIEKVCIEINGNH